MAAFSSSSNWGFAVLLLLSLSLPRGFSLTCTSQKFSANNVFSHCADLPVLAAYLHWTYDASNSSLSIAFLAPPPSPGGWVAWAINPTDTGMVGSQTLVAYQPAGGAPIVETYNVASYGDIKPAKLSFEVWDMAAEFSGGVMRIFAKLKVPVKTTVLNQVWQVGPSVDGTILAKHDFLPENLNARGTVSLSDGDVKTPAATGVDRRTLKKNIHGVLNVVSWGLLFPIGIVIARYMRVFPSADPAWFYLHISCQISAYVIGVAGWGTGMKLGSESVGYEVSDHRNIGIALFSMATVQMFALFLRPKKDHKYRLFWNIYHHTVGYTILILGIVNVFKGFDILNPDRKWKSAYIVAVAVVGAVAGVLEAITWVVVLKRKRSGNGSKRYDGEAREQFGS